MTQAKKRQQRLDLRERLRRSSLTQVWLSGRLEQCGFVLDKGELSSMLSGTRHGPKAEKVLSESERILTEYERFENRLETRLANGRAERTR